MEYPKDTKAEQAAAHKAEADHTTHELRAQAEKNRVLAESAAGEVVTGYRLYKNEQCFVIGVRKQENPNLPVDSPRVINWRIRVQNGIAAAIDDSDSDGVTGIEVYKDRPFTTVR